MPQISDTETIYTDDELMPAGDGFSGSQDQISEISDNQLDNETNPSKKKNLPISLKERYGVDLQKVGKMTKIWV